MTAFNGLAALIHTISEASRMSVLLSMSDHDLAARGLDRDGLTRSYIEGLGAR